MLSTTDNSWNICKKAKSLQIEKVKTGSVINILLKMYTLSHWEYVTYEA